LDELQFLADERIVERAQKLLVIVLEVMRPSMLVTMSSLARMMWRWCSIAGRVSTLPTQNNIYYTASLKNFDEEVALFGWDKLGSCQ
jgi:hypothetical protein